MGEAVTAVGHADAVEKLIRLVAVHATDLVFSYDRADGPPLEEDEEPDLDEALAWKATAIRRFDGRELTGVKIQAGGGRPEDGLLLALIALAERLGVMVVVVQL